MGAVRFARTDSFGEAFNFSAILAHIGRIGWGPYIVALIVLMVVIGVINAVLSDHPDHRLAHLARTQPGDLDLRRPGT